MSLDSAQLKGGELFLDGTVLSHGVWHNFYYSPDVVSIGYQGLLHKPVYIEHTYDSDPIGKVIKVWFTDGAVKCRLVITDAIAIQKFQNGELNGLSVNVDTMVDRVRKIVLKITRYKEVSLCQIPACKVCYVEHVAS